MLPSDSEDSPHVQVPDFPIYSPSQSHKSITISEHNLSSSVDSTRSPPATSPTLPYGSRVPLTVPAVNISSLNGWASSRTQALSSARLSLETAGGLGSDPSVLVPVIIAPFNKGKISVTTEVPLYDILNGSAPNMEGTYMKICSRSVSQCVCA